VAVAAGAAGCGDTSGVALGVAELSGDALGNGDATGVAVGVGLGLGCMFIALLSASFPSGAKTIWRTLFWLSLAASCGTATSYCQVDPTNLSPFSLTSQRT